MPRFIFARFATVALIACGQAASARADGGEQAAAAASAGFDSYWTAFRAAVLAHDMKTVAALSAAPVRSKGQLDDDPIRMVPPVRLPAELARALATPAGDQGIGPSTLDRIRTTPHLSARELDGGNHQRFGSLGFTRVRGRWTLTTIYRASD